MAAISRTYSPGRKSSAEIEEQLAQIRAGLGIARVGPQEKREVFAGLRYVAVQHKKRQQRSHAVRVDRRDQMLPERKAQLSKQLDTDRRHCRILQKNRSEVMGEYTSLNSSWLPLTQIRQYSGSPSASALHLRLQHTTR